jgi:FixJ family two-component response regulator
MITKISLTGHLEHGSGGQDDGHIQLRRQSRLASEQASHIVMIVNADCGFRSVLRDLLMASDLCTVEFGSAAEYLAFPKPAIPACLILDVDLPDTNGLDLQQQLGHDYHPPIIFLTGRGDIPSSVRAIRAGAFEFLTKPVCEKHLLQLVRSALARDQELRIEYAEQDQLRRRYDCLTSREREVLPLVVSGLLNKQAAAHLGISDVTLQIHRTNIMRKMSADSFADLVRMAVALEIPVTFSRTSRSTA